MLPNRFPDRGEKPEFNSVDASLWYIIAVNDYLLAATKQPSLTDDCHTKELHAAVEAILAGYNEGTRFGIRADRDGLLSAGEHGQQLTWMDARVDGHEITPRIGKPVEIQALWLNALAIGAKFSARWQSLFDKGRAAFEEQVLERARRLSRGRGRLRSPTGDCRSYISSEPNLGSRRATVTIARERKSAASCRCGRNAFAYASGSTLARARRAGLCIALPGRLARSDAIYHQGTVWPWLIGRIRRGVGPRPWLHTPKRKRKRAPSFSRHLSTSERGRTRSHIGNLRRRTAAHPTWLSVSSVVV